MCIAAEKGQVLICHLTNAEYKVLLRQIILLCWRIFCSMYKCFDGSYAMFLGFKVLLPRLKTAVWGTKLWSGPLAQVTDKRNFFLHHSNTTQRKYDSLSCFDNTNCPCGCCLHEVVYNEQAWPLHSLQGKQYLLTQHNMCKPENEYCAYLHWVTYIVSCRALWHLRTGFGSFGSLHGPCFPSDPAAPVLPHRSSSAAHQSRRLATSFFVSATHKTKSIMRKCKIVCTD